MIDLVKTWVLAAVVYVGINFVLSFTIGYSIGIVYLVCPFLAGAAASMYHADWGKGGWVRHLIAVLAVPVAMTVYWTFVSAVPTLNLSTAAIISSFGTTIVAAGLGLGAVMLVRALLGSARGQSGTETPEFDDLPAAEERRSLLPRRQR